MPCFSNQFWSAILAREDSKLNSGATRDAVAAFESECSFVLPDAHREFLLRGNGGIVGYCRLFGVGRNDYFDLKHQVTDMSPYIEGIIERSVFPIACDWGGSFFVTISERLLLHWIIQCSAGTTNTRKSWNFGRKCGRNSLRTSSHLSRWSSRSDRFGFISSAAVKSTHRR